MKTIKCRKLEPGMWLVLDPATYVIQSVNSLGWGKFSIRVRGIGTVVNTDITVWGGDAVAIAEPTKEEIYEDGIAYHKELASLLEMTGATLKEAAKEIVDAPKRDRDSQDSVTSYGGWSQCACPQCYKPVRDGMGAVPFKHRFDYCQCLMVLRHLESDWTKS
jgi:hypothetical protein